MKKFLQAVFVAALLFIVAFLAGTFAISGGLYEVKASMGIIPHDGIHLIKNVDKDFVTLAEYDLKKQSYKAERVFKLMNIRDDEEEKLFSVDKLKTGRLLIAVLTLDQDIRTYFVENNLSAAKKAYVDHYKRPDLH